MADESAAARTRLAEVYRRAAEANRRTAIFYTKLAALDRQRGDDKLAAQMERLAERARKQEAHERRLAEWVGSD